MAWVRRYRTDDPVHPGVRIAMIRRSFLLLALLFCLPLSTWAAPGDVMVYFGSFDPPHLGHLAVAKGAMDGTRVERVLLVPERTSERGEIAPFPERLAMCRLLAHRNKGIEVLDSSAIERAWKLGGAKGWRQQVYEDLYPRLAAGSLVLDVIGMDRFNTLLQTNGFPRRDEPRMLVVVDRPGHPLDADAIHKSGVAPGKFLFLHPDVLDVQSKDVRSKLAAGADTSRELPGVLRRYIDGRGLYKR